MVTCSRTWRRWSLARSVLTKLYALYPDAALVHGDCPDGDRQLAGIWRSLGGRDEPWPADWERYGNAAGPIRNAEVLCTRPDMLVAFVRDRSRGASGTVQLARSAGVRALPFDHDGDYGDGYDLVDDA